MTTPQAQQETPTRAGRKSRCNHLAALSRHPEQDQSDAMAGLQRPRAVRLSSHSNCPVSRPSRSLRTRRAGRLELGGRPRLYIHPAAALLPLYLSLCQLLSVSRSGLDAYTTTLSSSRSLSLPPRLVSLCRTAVPAAATIRPMHWAGRYRRRQKQLDESCCPQNAAIGCR